MDDDDEADVLPDIAALESKCILDVFSMTELERIRQLRQQSPAAARLYLALNSQIAFQQIQPPAVQITFEVSSVRVGADFVGSCCPFTSRYSHGRAQ